MYREGFDFRQYPLLVLKTLNLKAPMANRESDILFFTLMAQMRAISNKNI
jgi:hypothetical protein